MTQRGWYPDPKDPNNQLRWWNGTAWTDDVAPRATGTAIRRTQKTTKALAVTAGTLAVVAVLTVGVVVVWFFVALSQFGSNKGS